MMHDLSLRPASQADYAELAAVFKAAALSNSADRECLLAHPEALHFSFDEFTSKPYLLIGSAQQILGFTSWRQLDDRRAELDDLFVLPNYQRRGLARRLSQQVLTQLREQGCQLFEVIANQQALRFYRSMGFVFSQRVNTEFGMADLLILKLAE